MLKKLISTAAFAVIMLCTAGPVEAQFDLRRIAPPRINLLRGLPDAIGPRGVHRNLIPWRTLRRALGALAVGTVGVDILRSLSDSQRRDLSRRVNRIVLGPRDREVVQSYEINKRKKVTIVASPVAPKCSFKNDPALIPVAVSDVEEKPKKSSKGKDEEKKDEDTVAFEQLPKEVQCRKVDIKMAELGTTKSDAPSTADTNAGVVCELTEGDWRPTRFSPKPQPVATDPLFSDSTCQDS